jgi:hypothetical protein
VVAGGLLAGPAIAHYSGFTGDDYYDVYIPTNGLRCAGAVCQNHSYSFVSAQDVASTGDPFGLCARLMRASDHGAYDAHCGTNFVRHCSPGDVHSSDQLDCHDQDHSDNIHAGATNGGVGTTVRIHGAY